MSSRSLNWKAAGSSILSFLLLALILPFLFILGIFKLVCWAIGFLVEAAVQLVLLLFVRYIYIFPIGRLHTWALRKCQNGKFHSKLGRTDVLADSYHSVSIHVIPCLVDNYAYLIINHGLPGNPVSQPLQLAEYRVLTDPDTIRLASAPSASMAYSPQASNDPAITAAQHPSQAELHAVIVDVGDSDAVFKGMYEISHLHYGGRPIRLESILTTHHHWDHQAGNRAVVEKVPRLRVYGGRLDPRIDCLTDKVQNGSVITIGPVTGEDPGVAIHVLETPCHTHGSVICRRLGFLISMVVILFVFFAWQIDLSALAT